MRSPDNPTRCVLLAPAGDGSDVRTQLDDQGWITHPADDPLPALAELCLLQRLDASAGPGWERSSGAALALVVVEPSRWDRLPEMLSAARRYVPAARLWAYEAGSLRPMPNAAAPETYDIPTAEPPVIDQPAISGDEIAMLLDMDTHDTDAPDHPDMDPDR